MMQTITKNVSEMVIGELQKLGMFPTTVVNTSSRGCTDSLPEETTRRLTACSTTEMLYDFQYLSIYTSDIVYILT